MAQAILKKVLGTLAVSAAVMGATAQMAAAQVGFTGSYAPDQWELFNGSPAFPNVDTTPLRINDIPLAPFNGSADFTDAPNSLTLLGSNQSEFLDQFGLSCESTNLPPQALFLCDRSFTTVFVTVPEKSTLFFDWDYSTADSGGARFDPFGFAIGTFPPDSPNTDGVFTELIDRNGPATQSGNTSIEVLAGHIFGFQIGTADNQFGRSQATIRNFQAMVTEPDEVEAVPEPTSAVAIALLTGLGLRLSKKNRSDR
ncbi:MAG: hypothetical protein AAF572_00245 [Cyanobacteria bacterium P01_B01_bin.77]